jgi:hypothetical protein
MDNVGWVFDFVIDPWLCVLKNILESKNHQLWVFGKIKIAESLVLVISKISNHQVS